MIIDSLDYKLENGHLTELRYKKSIDCPAMFEFEGWVTSWPPRFTAARRELPGIRKVIFNPPATIIYWDDNSKTVVKCGENDEWDKEKGLAMAVAKKAMGNHGNYNNAFKRWLNDD